MPFVWYEAITPNMQKFVKFYREVCHFEVNEIVTQADYTFLEYQGFPVAGVANWLTGVAFPQWVGWLPVKSLAATRKLIEAAGGVCAEPSVKPLFTKALAFSDPQGGQGVICELDLATPPPALRGACESESKALGFSNLYSRDALAIKSFYEQVFAWSFTAVAPDTWQIRPPESSEILAELIHMPSLVYDLWLHFIAVKDLQATLKDVEKHGGKLVSGSWSLHRGREKQAAVVIADPTGVRTGLYEDRSLAL